MPEIVEFHIVLAALDDVGQKERRQVDPSEFAQQQILDSALNYLRRKVQKRRSQGMVICSFGPEESDIPFDPDEEGGEMA